MARLAWFTINVRRSAASAESLYRNHNATRSSDLPTSNRLISLLNHVALRSSEKSREREAVLAAVGDFDDERGSITHHRAMAYFWHAFQDQIPAALDELGKDAA